MALDVLHGNGAHDVVLDHTHVRVPAIRCTIHDINGHPVNCVHLVRFGTRTTRRVRQTVLDLARDNMRNFILSLQNGPNNLLVSDVSVDHV